MSELPELIENLKQLKSKSTRVVGWYAHYKEVRGPFCRWFTCSEVEPPHDKDVATTMDDCAYAAACMNDVPELVKAYEQIFELLKDIAPSWLPENIRDRRREILKNIK